MIWQLNPSTSWKSLESPRGLKALKLEIFSIIFLYFLYPKNQQCAIIYAFLFLAYLRLFHWPYCLIWIMILSFPPQNPKSSLAVWDQSHYREVQRWKIFYGTGIEIWAGFGPIGSTEKKGSGPIMSNFWGPVF